MIFLTSLIIIIVCHELGHFFAAKFFKCGVPEFAFGFGPTLFQKKFGETTYKINLLPMGGYVTLQDELNFSLSKFAFTNKTYTQKCIIALAGIFVNVVMGVVAYFIGQHLYNPYLIIFGIYSLAIGISNALPIPALDGSYVLFFLLEYKFGKKRTYEIMRKVFGSCFKWIMILNILSIPLLIWLIYTGQII